VPIILTPKYASLGSSYFPRVILKNKKNRAADEQHNTIIEETLSKSDKLYMYSIFQS
jgi:hypothetical protein